MIKSYFTNSTNFVPILFIPVAKITAKPYSSTIINPMLYNNGG